MRARAALKRVDPKQINRAALVARPMPPVFNVGRLSLQLRPSTKTLGGPMKKQVCRSCLTFLVLTVLWAVPFLHAQSSPLICKVPFEFIVGKTSLPSGQYAVKPVSFGSPAIMIQKDDGRGNVITLTNSPQTGQAQDNKAKLV